jgi:hypothetical protein
MPIVKVIGVIAFSENSFDDAVNVKKKRDLKN